MTSQRLHVFSEPHVSTAIWLTQLRWVAVAGQLLVIGYVWFVLQIPLPIAAMLLLILYPLSAQRMSVIRGALEARRGKI